MIRIGLTLSLATLVSIAPSMAGGPDPIVLGTTGRAHPDVRRGIEFGEHEMARTARLLGRDVRVVRSEAEAGSTSGTRPDGWIVFAGKSPSPDVPVIHLGQVPPSAGACEFAIGLDAPEAGADAVLWHPSLGRFGASELNERFLRRYDLPMTGEAWAGWASVKALVESALRRRPDEHPCAALARLRFDGHKGQPLYFDTATRVLSQPVYRLKEGNVVGERK